jgi:tRNA(fMet)-specific endonuclease VapC
VTQFVLDSDTISLLQDRHPEVIAHVASHAADDVATTIIGVEEQLSGWYTLLRRAKTPAGLVPIYQRMSETVRFFCTLPLLTFTETAARVYERLLKEKRGTGRMDLRIAAIALAHGATVVTRNVSDFQDIEGIQVVDWSRP